MKQKEILKSGDQAPEISSVSVATEAKTVTGKTVFVNQGEVVVLEKESNTPFVCSKRLWDNVYSKQPEKFELKKT